MTIGEELTGIVGASFCLTDPKDLEGVTEDWRGRYRGPAICLVRPASTEETAAVVACCAKYGVPILPQGGNTSLCGGSVPSPEGPAPVMISLTRMRKVRSIDPLSGTMEVEAGCVLAHVQEAAREAGCLYPVSFGAEGSCQIGGTIATNAGGSSVLRYGNTRDNVLGIEAVLPDGTIWSSLSGLRKNNTGYDLKHLFIGSEGTLGVITAATLKLHPWPSRSATAWVGLASHGAAIELLWRVRKGSGGRVSAFELINRPQLDLIVGHAPNQRSPLQTEHDWHLLIELSDSGGEDDLNACLEGLLAQAFEDDLVSDAAIASNEAQQQAMWQVRHGVAEANRKSGIGLTMDCAVPTSAVPNFINEATEAVRSIAPDVSVLVISHLGDGNVHFTPHFSFDAWKRFEDPRAVESALRQAANDVADRLGGTFSAEHGVGRVSLAEMARYKSAAELRMMWIVKQGLDPDNLMNPGRVLPALKPA
jgi:FAD/FMN-containing dehydrogenase